MSRLAKLNEKNAAKDEDKSLEIKEKQRILIDTLRNDSVYWEKARPIPLTAEEEQAALEGPVKDLSHDTSKLVINIGADLKTKTRNCVRYSGCNKRQNGRLLKIS
jgi:hypothetical protein